jgi:glucose/arabinose dehydrogenase
MVVSFRASRAGIARATLATLVCFFGWVRGTGSAATLPPNFQESTVFSGLVRPTVVRFAPDGRVFVAEKSGLIRVFDSVSSTTSTVFADLRPNVHDFWDRGLLGMALDPQFAAGRPFVYVLYSLDRNPGDPAATVPTWGDSCPNPPGATSSGCAILARLSRLEASDSVMVGPEQVLLEGWCQQFPSHSVGSLAFGPDGALYVSSGDGASFNTVDYGQFGGASGAGVGQTVPRNVCADPPGGLGGVMTPPTAQGGALRSQSARRPAGQAAVLNGAILRVDPDTGAAFPGNPLSASPDPNARRIVAYGLRNPFRFALRPGTSEVWIGDVGWNAWEEIDRVADPTAGVVNLGWPCYEGAGRQGGYDGAHLDSCESLYSSSPAMAPFFAYSHGATVVAGEACPTGSSSVAGLAFYTTGSYPSSYQGALFFTDYNRKCLWAMLTDPGGVPDPGRIVTFAAGLSGGAVHLEIGPGGDLYYVDYDGGRLQRIAYARPTAVATATPTSGPAPLLVQFDGSASTAPPGGQPLTYAWDLDGDGAFDDSSLVAPAYTYVVPGNHTVSLRVTDALGASATTSLTISAGNTAPVATIVTPGPSLTWEVGEDISFSGIATDAQEGTLPASRLAWSLVLQHCPSGCHEHVLQTFPGTASGGFSAPDHEYPSYLELRLTATDGLGLSDTKSVTVQPRTVDLAFESAPMGLSLTVNAASDVTPFTRRVIVGSTNSLGAPSPQEHSGLRWSFSSWSDDGAAAHDIVAPAASATWRATYTAEAPALAFYALRPCRVLDTREASGPTGGAPLSGGTELRTAVAGRCGVPVAARAVAANLTVTQPSAAGHLVAYPSGLPTPFTSTVSFAAGVSRSSQAVIGLGPAGEAALLCRPAGATLHAILDVTGYFE